MSFTQGQSSHDALKVLSPFKRTYDVVWTNENHEADDDYYSLKDGRSRRYFFGMGTFWHMLSAPITECFVLFNIPRRSTDDDFGLCRVTMLRYVKHVHRNNELIFTLLLLCKRQ